MRILVNAINAISPGAFNLVYNFIDTLSKADSSNQYLILLPSDYGYETLNLSENMHVKYFKTRRLKILWYIYFYAVNFKRILEKYSIQSILCFGNFNPLKTGIPTLVLLHNAYYVDFKAISCLSFIERIRIRLGIVVFSMTVKNTEKFIVQTAYIKNLLATVWNIPYEKIEVCSNPLSKNLSLNNKPLVERPDILKYKFGFLYVSRYYPYKNHDFVLKVAKMLQSKGIEDIIFLVTINDSIKAARLFLEEIENLNLEATVINIGELPQYELNKWYQSSGALFYPSSIETFGNPLVEAMSFGLPVCVVDLPYAKAVCGEAALYFKEDSVEDAVRNILKIKDDDKLRKELAMKGLQKISRLPTWEETVKKYTSIITSQSSQYT
jgi:glycosyltransferase involved in cell wall biosynthesis